MICVEEALKKSESPRILAQAVLAEYFGKKQVVYPIDPFQMLTDHGVPFVFRAFQDKRSEGMYIPAQGKGDIAVVGINIRRPIYRQRYTAAHELCHHIKDSTSTQMCDANRNNPIEKYAEEFAAELLMPYTEMKQKIKEYAPTESLCFDDVLEISEYFGVSFQSCLYRAAWVYHKIGGDVTPKGLARRAKSYHADKVREKRGYVYTPLYEQLINADEPWLRQIAPTAFILSKYCNSCIYNDSRLEGVDLESSKVAEIVTDIRLHGSESPYCNQGHQKEVEVAGHARMYERLFEMSENTSMSLDIFSIVPLHKALYSCAPAPEFGGSFRTDNAVITDAKTEIVDHNRIISELLTLAPLVKELFDHPHALSLANYIKKVAEIHHRLTVIHPFGDGNGRASRGFINLFLIRRGLLPIYIRVQEKDEYKEALSTADTTGNYDDLYLVLFKALMRAQAEFTEAPPI